MGQMKREPIKHREKQWSVMWEENQERMESETPRQESVLRKEKPIVSKAAMRLQKVETENRERLGLFESPWRP